MNLTMYTDGGCWNSGRNKGRAAWSFVAIDEHDVLIAKEVGLMPPSSTNNRAEYTAFIQAVEWALDCYGRNNEAFNVTIFSDSMLLVNTYNGWMHGWKAKEMIHQRKNSDLVEKFLELYYRIRKINNFTLKLKWVKGHSGNRWNDMCDEMCSRIMRDASYCNGEEYEEFENSKIQPHHTVLRASDDSGIRKYSGEPVEFLEPAPVNREEFDAIYDKILESITFHISITPEELLKAQQLLTANKARLAESYTRLS